MGRPKGSKNKLGDAERFWENIAMIPEHTCWEWVGTKNQKGYGVGWFNGRLMLAHRYSYEIHLGKIPDGLHACHRCDNPGCCRPSHIFLGTNLDNRRDSQAKGRMRNQNTNKMFCENGHKFTENNTAKTKKGRACRRCRLELSRKWFAKNRQKSIEYKRAWRAKQKEKNSVSRSDG